MAASIRRDVELFEWLKNADERHQRTDEGCSCGWPLPFNRGDCTWDSHREVATVADLGDVLASDTSDRDGVMSWRECCVSLYGTVDVRDEVEDEILGALLDIAYGPGDDRSKAIALNTIRKHAPGWIPEEDRSSSGEQSPPPSPPA